MNETRFERFLADQFASARGTASPADSVDKILIEARRMRPLPRWLAIIKEPPMRISSRVSVGSPMARVVSLATLTILLAVLTTGALVAGTSLVPNGPRTLTVAPDGTGDYTTISDAISAAQAGDRVIVKPGTYAESISVSTAIDLVGDGPPGSVVIEFDLDSPSVVSMAGDTLPSGIRLDDADAHLSNLAITGPRPGVALWVSGGAPMLDDISTLLEGDGFPHVSFEFTGGSTATLSDAIGDGQIRIGEGASPTIERVIMERGGFIRGSGTKPLISDSAFALALDIGVGAEPTLEGNELLGLAITSEGTPVIRGNTIHNPEFVAGAAHDSSEVITAIEVKAGTPLIVGNRIGDHEVGISVSPGSMPTIEGNRIDANTTGVSVSSATTEMVLSGNTFCDNVTDLAVPDGSALTLEGNEICATAQPPAAWIATGSMTEKRGGHSATLLPDGNVLVAGGESARAIDEDWDSPSSSELYDPETGEWRATGDMTAARPGAHSATHLPDGRVLVVGGDAGNAAIRSAELFDPENGTWSATGPMVEAHGRGHTATLLPDGRVLVAGGFQGGEYLAAAELYDPGSDTWSAIESMSAGRVYHTATLLPDGRVLVAGSVRMNGVPIPEDRLGQTTELYDPDAGRWSVTGSMIETRHDFAALLLDDGTVLAGPDDNSLSTELYDPSTGTWSATGSVAVRRIGGYTATLLPDGRVLIFGGHAAAELYDPRNRTWTAADSRIPRHANTATLLTDGSVLVAGGVDSEGAAELFVVGRED